MSFSGQSLESSHSSETGRSFSEAFLNTSSARDALPEQYHTHFDELRGGILAFCKEFGIPTEALSSVETFGAALSDRSSRISLSKMDDVSLLFRSLEHLITYHELWKNPEELQDALLEAEQLYDLFHQYHAQVELLQNAGVLTEDGHSAFMGMDGQKYVVPPMESIARKLYERRETLRTKQEQKFTRLLLVPFGMSLDVLVSVFRKFLRDYQREHQDFDMDINEPIRLWEESEEADNGEDPSMVYDPKFFDSENHGGKTKHQILIEQEKDSTFAPGWRVLLLQAPHDDSPGFRDIPKAREGVEEGDNIFRPDLEVNKPPSEYLSILQEAQKNSRSPYHGESGMIPEDWIAAFMTHLQESEKRLDDYETGGISYLTGSFFPVLSFMLFVCWDHQFKQVLFGRKAPFLESHNHGARSVVIV